MLTFVSPGQTDNLCGSPLLEIEHKVDTTCHAECTHAANWAPRTQIRMATTTALTQRLSAASLADTRADAFALPMVQACNAKHTSQVLMQGCCWVHATRVQMVSEVAGTSRA